MNKHVSGAHYLLNNQRPRWRRATGRFLSVSVAVCLLLVTLADAPRAEEENVSKAGAAVAAAKRLRAFDRPGLAEMRLEGVLKSEPTAREVLILLAELNLGELYRPQKAHDIYLTLIDLNKEDSEAHLGAAEAAFLLAGRYIGTPEADRGDKLTAEAVKHAKQALKLDNNLVKAQFLLGEINRFEALNYPTATSERDQNLVIARRYYLAALKNEPSHTRSLLACAKVEIDLGLADEAMKKLAALTLLEGESLFLEELRARVALILQPPDFEMFHQAMGKVNDFHQTLETRTVASLAKRTAAMDDKVLALELVTLLQNVYVDLTATDRLRRLAPYIPRELKEGETRERPVIPEFCYLAADATYQQVVELEGDQRNRDKNTELIASLYRRTIELLEPAQEIVEDVPDVLRIQANANMRLGRYDDAERDFKATAMLDRDDRQAAAYAEAMPEIKAGHMTLQHFERYLNLRWTHMKMDDRMAELQGLVAVAPEFAFAHTLLGDLLYQESSFEEAYQHYRAAIKAMPTRKAPRYGAGMVCVRLGRWEDARKYFKALHHEDPTYRSVREWSDIAQRVTGGKLKGKAVNYYQDSLARSLSKRDRRTLLDLALKLSPDFFEALHDNSQLAISEGEFDLSAGFAERLMSVARNDRERSSAHAALAEVAHATGHHGEAASQYALAREYELENDERRGALFWLEASMRFKGGEHGAVDDLLCAAIELGRPLAAFEPDLYGLEELGSHPPVVEEKILEIAPRLEKGQQLSFSLELNISTEGPENSRVLAAFDVNLEITDTPARDGLFEMNLGFDNLPPGESYAVLRDLELTMQISPWFGLLEEPVDDKGLSLTETHEAYAVVLPVIQVLCEIFTITRGTAAARWPYLWSNLNATGAAHLGSENEVCYLDKYDRGGIVIRRLGIDDFMEPNNPKIKWTPRQRLEAAVELDAVSRLPRAVSLTVRRSSLVEVEPDAEKGDDEKDKGPSLAYDVKISTMKVALVRKE